MNQPAQPIDPLGDTIRRLRDAETQRGDAQRERDSLAAKLAELQEVNETGFQNYHALRDAAVVLVMQIKAEGGHGYAVHDLADKLSALLTP